nr:la-related protein 6A [Tanacetum cinerariifolium]
MRWEGGVLGKYGQGILLPIEVNTRPNNLLTTNAIASQELLSEENEEEDEALSRPFKKKKTEHVDLMPHPPPHSLQIVLVMQSLQLSKGRLTASSSSSFSSDGGSCDAIALVYKRLLGRVKNAQRKKGHDSEKRSSVLADSLGHRTAYHTHGGEISKPPPGPRMPDGTRGFTMGRGRPLS